MMNWPIGKKEEIKAALYPNEFVPVNQPHQSLASVASKLPSQKPPQINGLRALVQRSTNYLFFIAHQVPSTSVYDWQLVQVAHEDTTSAHPGYLHVGKFLVDFYIQCPDDGGYNTIHQRYWMDYHKLTYLHCSDHSSSNRVKSSHNYMQRKRLIAS